MSDSPDAVLESLMLSLNGIIALSTSVVVTANDSVVVAVLLGLPLPLTLALSDAVPVTDAVPETEPVLVRVSVEVSLPLWTTWFQTPSRRIQTRWRSQSQSLYQRVTEPDSLGVTDTVTCTRYSYMHMYLCSVLVVAALLVLTTTS